MIVISICDLIMLLAILNPFRANTCEIIKAYSEEGNFGRVCDHVILSHQTIDILKTLKPSHLTSD